MTFRASIPIRFGHEDHAGLVYFPRFLHFFHCAFEDFFAAQGRPYKQVLDDDGLGWPTVHVEVDYKSPLRFGDRFDIDVWVHELGHKSATFAYRGSCAGRLVADARITVACVDLRVFEAIPIPPRYRRMFEAHAEPPGDL